MSISSAAADGIADGISDGIADGAEATAADADEADVFATLFLAADSSCFFFASITR